MVNKLIAQLVSAEIYTPKLEDSLWFFKEVLGLIEVGRRDGSVYLRGWGDFVYPYSLKLTEASTSGPGEISWRAYSQEDLNTVVRMLNDMGIKGEWADPDMGIGRGYRFKAPGGHTLRIFWNVERWRAPEELKSIVKVRPARLPLKGVGVRRIDHVNLYVNDVKSSREFYQKLGFRYHEGVVVEGANIETGAWMSSSGWNHDLALLADPAGEGGRLNHVAFYVDSLEDLIKAAEIYREYGLRIAGGPVRHGISEGYGLYVYEPGGNLIEVFHGGYVNWVPDWEPVIWYFPREFWIVANIWGLMTEAVMIGSPPPKELSPQFLKMMEEFRRAFIAGYYPTDIETLYRELKSKVKR